MKNKTAAKWNFLNFQSPNYSAVIMQFTTPASYATSTVNIGGIATDEKIVLASTDGSSSFPATKFDPDTDWDEPTKLQYLWKGVDHDGKQVEARLECDTGPRIDRVDIMQEVPAFVKKVIAGTAGTKPFIYQVSLTHKLSLELVCDSNIKFSALSIPESILLE